MHESMKDQEKTKGQLIEELSGLRERLARLDRKETDGNEGAEEFLDLIKDCACGFDQKGRLVAVNRALASRLGYTREELMDKNVRDLFPSHLHGRIERIISRAGGKAGQTLALPLLTRTGTEVAMETTFSRSRQGNGLAGYCVGRDVAERNQTEQLLQEQVYFLQTLIDAVPAPVFYKTLDLRYLGVNRAFLQYHGLERETLIGGSVYDVVPKEQAERHHELDMMLLEKGG